MNLELGLEQPARAQARPYTVSELTDGAKQHVQLLPTVWVEGEVSGFKEARGGHCYFALKDATSSVACVMWADDVRRLKDRPADGAKVFARGKLTVFPRKGQLQFTVYRLLPTAEGGPAALALEQARAALARDGLLDPARKRRLPAFARCVGVVTSAEGAAWRDVVKVVGERWPLCELVLVASRVQGDGAPRDLERAIEMAGRFERLDVLIVGRGGGSKEDLAAFNTERVARAVARSRAPTISAVGHESDVTLTDLVADARAPTPSAAAAMAVPDAAEVGQRIGGLRTRLSQAAGRRVQGASAFVAVLRSRMAAAVDRRTQRVDHRLAAALERMRSRCEARLRGARATADRLGASLDALSPLRVLDRGYSIARDEAGRVLKRAADFAPRRRFRLRVVDGEVNARSES